MSRQYELLEVWSDTVDSRHLLYALLLGSGMGATAYLLAARGFETVVDNPDVAQTYALLVGLIGSMAAAVIAAFTIEPKRVVVESEGTAESRRAAMATIEAEIGPFGDPSQLPPTVQEELRALGLYDDLADWHRDKDMDPDVETPEHDGPAQEARP